MALESSVPVVSDVSTPYRVLARKYRPTGFEDLIGQEPMVRTLSNAIDLGRIHQAYILTGVRGVGKTTTARILARAFNYELPAIDGRPAIKAPTIHMPTLGVHCQAIIESRHVDVIEMDAASHTGIDDIREIIESARYRPVMARTKVYIIDEVHMLSKQAFNGLLKTLEEPPEHVKFIFATTEIDKIPVTVRSRCQRFDLRRIESNALIAHLERICAQEQVLAEPEALAMIARAAEGSVRDSLSLLDQAIAGGGTVRADALREMLGLADRSRIIDLFESAMKGDMAAALDGLKHLHDCGAEPVQTLSDLADFTHFVTRIKVAPDLAQDPSVTEAERLQGTAFAQGLSMAALTRAWQILVKGLQEIRDSARPRQSAEMTLIRLGYAADMPSPDELIQRLRSTTPIPPGVGQSAHSSPATGHQNGPSVAPRSGAAHALAQPQRAPTPVQVQEGPQLETFAQLLSLASEKRDLPLKYALENEVRLTRFEAGRMEFALAPGGSPELPQTLMRKLQEWTGRRWMVALSCSNGAPSVAEQKKAHQEQKRAGILEHALVRAALAQFPDAQILGVQARNEEAFEPSFVGAGAPDEIIYFDESEQDD